MLEQAEQSITKIDSDYEHDAEPHLDFAFRCLVKVGEAYDMVADERGGHFIKYFHSVSVPRYERFWISEVNYEKLCRKHEHDYLKCYVVIHVEQANGETESSEHKVVVVHHCWFALCLQVLVKASPLFVKLLLFYRQEFFVFFCEILWVLPVNKKELLGELSLDE